MDWPIRDLRQPLRYGPNSGRDACFIEEHAMTFAISTKIRTLAVSSAALLACTPALAEMSATELAKAAQNPISDLISLPFQNNINLNYGPEKGTQNVLNIQPVIPIHVNSEWNILTRTIVPLIWNPSLGPGDGATNGIGDIEFSTLLSPANPGKWIWGAGPITQLPTNSNRELGNKNWGLGPELVVLHKDAESAWVFGAVINNIWSLSSSKQGGSYSTGLIQPFVNYNVPGMPGFYLMSAPLITVNWNAEGNNKWTVPLGGGVGKIFHIGKLPVNSQLNAYYNVVTPDFGANWQIRVQMQFLFPE
jgi:hypothetical protein